MAILLRAAASTTLRMRSSVQRLSYSAAIRARRNGGLAVLDPLAPTLAEDLAQRRSWFLMGMINHRRNAGGGEIAPASECIVCQRNRTGSLNRFRPRPDKQLPEASLCAGIMSLNRES